MKKIYTAPCETQTVVFKSGGDQQSLGLPLECEGAEQETGTEETLGSDPEAAVLPGCQGNQ